MFRPGGWKEFGLSANNSYTVFPFWMFTIVWAILSYVFATLAAVMFASVTLQSVPNASSVPTFEGEFGMDDVADVAEPIYKPISRQAPRMRAIRPPAPVLAPVQQPGYYILESPVNSAPKYVYYGTEPPSFENLVEHTH